MPKIPQAVFLSTVPTFLNTIPPLEGACSKIKYLDVSPIFADAIQRIYEENSMSVLF